MTLINFKDLIIGMICARRADLVVLRDKITIPAESTVTYNFFLPSSVKFAEKVYIVSILQAYSESDDTVTLNLYIDDKLMIDCVIKNSCFCDGFEIPDLIKPLMDARRNIRLDFINPINVSVSLFFMVGIAAITMADFDSVMSYYSTEINKYLKPE